MEKDQSDPKKPKPGGAGAVPVVAVGASAGGLDAFRRLLKALPPDSGVAFVLIQHLDPNHESLMANLLSKHTDMPVVEVNSATRLRPDHVYMIPPKKFLKLQNGGLALVNEVRRRGVRLPIDYFFRSMAMELRERAIAVILSGTGSDGTLGAKEVKTAGGMVVAQQPDSAEYDGMPRSAISAGVVDYVLPIDEMAAVLDRYVHHPYVGGAGDGWPGEDDDKNFQSILSLLRARTDYDFRCYKRGTLGRRIQRRMGLRHAETVGEYLQLLKTDSSEVRNLFRDLLIGVTRFFREKEAWTALDEEVVEVIVARKKDGESVRVWVPACSTGEEAYSLAMLFQDRFEAQEKNLSLQVFATDLDARAIETARAGSYPVSIAQDVSKKRLKRYFAEEDGQYHVAKRLRDPTVFAVQNLLTDPPFSRLDLVSCRNVLIYLEPEVQRRLLDTFHFALADSGYLFLGASETCGRGRFEPVSAPWRIYQKSADAQQGETALLAAPSPAPRAPGVGRRALRAPLATQNPLSAVDHAKRALERFSPSAVVIDRANEVQYFYGPVRKYLDFPEGEPTREFPAIVIEALRGRVTGLIHRCRHTGEAVSAVAPGVETNGGREDVEVLVEPVRGARGGAHLLVVFRDRAPDERRATEGSDEGAGQGGTTESTAAEQLEHELQATREDLQSTIEEAEASNEELKASNEEVMSMNEELQSANEELETSREELQSLNEELATVNSQLEDKVAELEDTNNDLTNLITSTDIATIFLDDHLKIRRFTPAASDLLKVIPTDVGRPISDLSPRVSDSELEPQANRVLETLVVQEEEVSDDAGRVYIRKIRPFRTSENRIEGVVITFTDVTAAVRARERLAAREGQQAAIAALGRSALSGMSVDELCEEAVKALDARLDVDFSKVLEYVPEDRELLLRAGVGWPEGLVGVARVSSGMESQAGFTLANRGPVIVRDLREEKRFSGPSLLTEQGVVSGMSAVIGPSDSPWGVVGVHSVELREYSDDDVTFVESVANTLAEAIARKHAQERLKLSEERLRLAQQAGGVGVWDWDLAAGVVIWSDEQRRVTGLDVRDGESPGRFFESVHPDDRQMVKQALENAVSGAAPYQAEFRFRRGDGEDRWLSGRGSVYFEGDKAVRMIGINIDVTDRKRTEEALRGAEVRLTRSLAEIESVYNSAPIGLCALDAEGRIIRANETMAQLTRVSLVNMVGRSIAEATPDFYQAAQPLVEGVMRGGPPKNEAQVTVRREDGKKEEWLTSWFPVKQEEGQLELVTCVVENVTERRAVEVQLDRYRRGLEKQVAERTKELQRTNRRLEQSRAELRRLTTRLVDVQEETHRHLARELHDVFGQHLAVLAMQIGQLTQLAASPSREFNDQAARVREEVERLAREIHELAKQLHPAILEDLGLAAALKELCESFTELQSVESDCDTAGADGLPLPAEIQRTLYRIAQECLTNIAKHAGAAKVLLRLKADAEWVTLEVTDNGGGFDPTSKRRNGGLGLVGMRERAQHIGGDLTITSKPGAGTTVEVRAPMPEPQEGE